MSNIVKTQNEIAQSMVNKLQQRINPLKKISGKTALLLDTSSSMTLLTDGQMRRIDALVLALKPFENDNIRRFQFNNRFEEITIETKLSPIGGTDLAHALHEIKQFDFQNIILITDGEPDDKQTAMYEASQLNATINVVFVGNPHHLEAIQFCEDLAKKHNGQFASNPLEVKTLGLLPNTVRLMIGDGNESNKPIAL